MARLALKFSATDIEGAFVVDLETHSDDRGFFARSFCASEFEAHGLDPTVAQCNISWNRAAGTLRGMHGQAHPHGEPKLIRCTRGAIHDVAVDLRSDSPTRGRRLGVDLTAENRRSVYLPPGVVHGFITLVDDTEVVYQMGAPYVADAAIGFRFDDPALGIVWPRGVAVISERDATWPLIQPG